MGPAALHGVRITSCMVYLNCIKAYIKDTPNIKSSPHSTHNPCPLESKYFCLDQ